MAIESDIAPTQISHHPSQGVWLLTDAKGVSTGGAPFAVPILIFLFQITIAFIFCLKGDDFMLKSLVKL